MASSATAPRLEAHWLAATIRSRSPSRSRPPPSSPATSTTSVWLTVRAACPAPTLRTFKLEPSIKVVPSSANSGDTVNVFAQDYPKSAGEFKTLLLAGEDISNTVIESSKRSIANDGSGEVAFKVPGGYEGVLRIDATWGTVKEDAKITLAGAQLNASKTDALPQRDHYHHR